MSDLLPDAPLHRAWSQTRRDSPSAFAPQLQAALRRHGQRAALRRRPDPVLQRRPVRRRHRPRPGRATGCAILRRVAQLDWSSIEPVHLRHAVRAQPRPGQARPARRALHQPRGHPAHRRAGPDGTRCAGAGQRCRRRPDELAASVDGRRRRPKKTKLDNQLHELLHRLRRRARRCAVLDPACGSGNFLYVALRLAARPGEGSHRPAAGAGPAPVLAAPIRAVPGAAPRHRDQPSTRTNWRRPPSGSATSSGCTRTVSASRRADLETD